MVQKQHCAIWKKQKRWNKILKVLEGIPTIKHIYREGNSVADALANHGIRLGRNFFFSSM